jgi:hypothetical protein
MIADALDRQDATPGGEQRAVAICFRSPPVSRRTFPGGGSAMQEITITMMGDGIVDLIRVRSFGDSEALGVFIALMKIHGDEPWKRRGRRAVGSTSDDNALSTAPAAVETTDIAMATVISHRLAAAVATFVLSLPFGGFRIGKAMRRGALLFFLVAFLPALVSGLVLGQSGPEGRSDLGVLEGIGLLTVVSVGA